MLVLLNLSSRMPGGILVLICRMLLACGILLLRRLHCATRDCMPATRLAAYCPGLKAYASVAVMDGLGLCPKQEVKPECANSGAEAPTLKFEGSDNEDPVANSRVWIGERRNES